VRGKTIYTEPRWVLWAKGDVDRVRRQQGEEYGTENAHQPHGTQGGTVSPKRHAFFATQAGHVEVAHELIKNGRR